MRVNDNRAKKATSYFIYASLREDVNSGWVWVNYPQFRQRAVVSILNVEKGEKVYCEILQIDENFLKYYNSKNQGRLSIDRNKSTLVINQWYRKKLGDLSTQTNYDLQIHEVDKLHGKIISCFQHPQVIIRIATWLGLISVVLGFFSLVISLVSLF